MSNLRVKTSIYRQVDIRLSSKCWTDFARVCDSVERRCGLTENHLKWTVAIELWDENKTNGSIELDLEKILNNELFADKSEAELIQNVH